MTRFDYNDPIAVMGAIQWAIEHDSCPECLCSTLVWEETTDSDGFVDVWIECPHCKKWAGGFGSHLGSELLTSFK
jgi:hypothetical protein